jgi:hypothetical protein
MTRKTETQRNTGAGGPAEQRPDEAIWEDIHDHLSTNPDLVATEVEIVV